ncbi:Nn.00g040030.m01.CDS01 [Neocucurbitaria sp. VM-36]
MGQDQATEDDGYENYTASATPNIPTISSSTLSDAPLTQQLNSPESLVATPNDDEHTHEQAQEQAGSCVNVLGSARAVTAEDNSSDGEADVSFNCPHCDKTYSTETSLKRHLKDKRSRCARNRSHTVADGMKWACPRCNARLGKKYFAEDSCWRICHECCEAGNTRCDAFHKDGICTNCEDTGKSCTQYSEAVPDCAPKLLADLPAQAHKPAPRPTHTGAIERSRKREKRKAVESPEVCPESKSVTKRPTIIIKEEDMDPGRLQPGPSLRMGGSRPRLAVRFADCPIPPTRNFNIERWLETSSMLTYDDHVLEPNIVRQHAPSDRFSQVPPSDAAPQYHNHVLPLQSCGYRAGNEVTLPLPSTSTPAQDLHQGQSSMAQSFRQSHRPSNHDPGLSHMSSGQVLPPNYNSFGMGFLDLDVPLYSTDTNEAMQETLLHQQRPSTSTRQYHPWPNEFDAMHPPNTRVGRFRPVNSINFPIHEDLPGEYLNRFYAAGLVASAPGSRMPSQEPSSYQAQDSKSMLSAQDGKHDRRVHDAKNPVLRELSQPIALKRSPSLAMHSNDATLNIKIHSNTYDSNGTAIFSILSIRSSQKFGPRLDAYCQHRKKQYGVDWIFIYCYRAATEENKDREKYINITYNMTPDDVKDEEYPGMAIADMDTIFVMKARPRSLTMAENENTERDASLSPLGSQASSEEISIMNGETSIYQDGKTITHWFLHSQKKLIEFRNETGELKSTVAMQAKTMAEQEKKLSELKSLQTLLLHQNIQLSQRHQPPYGQTLPRLGQAIPSYSNRCGQRQRQRRRAPVQGPPQQSFISRLEAVREPVEPMPRQRCPPLQFPSFAGTSFAKDQRDRPLWAQQFPANGFQPVGYPGYPPTQGMLPQEMRPNTMPSQNSRREGPGRDNASKDAATQIRDEDKLE